MTEENAQNTKPKEANPTQSWWRDAKVAAALIALFGGLVATALTFIHDSHELVLKAKDQEEARLQNKHELDLKAKDQEEARLQNKHELDLKTREQEQAMETMFLTSLTDKDPKSRLFNLRFFKDVLPKNSRVQQFAEQEFSRVEGELKQIRNAEQEEARAPTKAQIQSARRRREEIQRDLEASHLSIRIPNY